MRKLLHTTHPADWQSAIQQAGSLRYLVPGNAWVNS